MFKEISDITNSILIGTSMVLILSGFIILNLIFYYIKLKKHLAEQEALKTKFQMELIQTQFEVQEQTRKNLASELHDNIGQLLSLTNVTLASINFQYPEKAEQKITDTQHLVTRSIKELRQLSKLIHGEHFIQQGLTTSIEQEINWLQRNGLYTVHSHLDLSTAPASNADKDLFVFRLLQESFNNILKHACADTIHVALHYDQGFLHLEISDNGIGFDAAAVNTTKQGLGLPNMQKRIQLLQGSMLVNATHQKGTHIIFQIPYP